MRLFSLTSGAATLATLFAVAACSDPSTSSPDARPLALSFTTRAAAASASLASAASSAADSAVFTKAQLVVMEIELEEAERGCDFDDNLAGTSTVASSVDDCEEIELDPVLIDLPLNNQVQTRFTANIPEGAYHEIEMKIDKPEDDSIGTAFVTKNPAFREFSVLAEGTYQGRPFSYQARVESKLEFDFEPALTVGSAGTNITVRVQIGRWFRAADGSPIDPATAGVGGVNEEIVKRNIAASIQAFADGNRDGLEH